MKRTAVCLLLAACLALCQPGHTSAAGDMENFTKSYAYEEAFADVAEDAVYEAYRDSVVVANAKHILTTGRGVCDDYSSAFQVMTRRIGLKSYFAQGSSYDQQGGISPHQVCIVEIGGNIYFFDPQIEDYNAKGKPHPYERFCRTFASMSSRYFGYDVAASKAAFGGFVRK
ncbi:MAG: hypothetical protein K5981_04510 [Clostridia bacterium]|nr:hypothetical protein [Clostridia bacterium]